MSQYQATRNYSSNHNGRFFAFSEGDVTEVDDDVAAWVNRDSPGTLEPVSDDDTPAASANKPEWVEYATARGVANAGSYTKQQLIDGAPDYDGFEREAGDEGGDEGTDGED